MDLIAEVVEFKVVINAANEAAHRLTKQQWVKDQVEIQKQLNAISNLVWYGGNDDDMAKAISETIFILAKLTCAADLYDKVEENLNNPINL